MLVTRMSRAVPGLRKALTLGNRSLNNGYILMKVPMRQFYRGGRDSPFAQMEEFMKDMERKFRRDMDNIFRDLPRAIETGFSRVPDVKPRPRFGDIEDISTNDTYKLAFCLPNAKPEDVKVTLKGRTLTVKGTAEEVTETSKSSRQIAYEYEVPEDVNVDALESSMSHDGILTIEAPRFSAETPKDPRPITVERE
ncbi:hypothetical protein SK128_019207 [Halocaridina rubra]|uniref:SHSP domain-containing protein n=1 Tax=Halocaridina rubra TaxID=373956 RepID=A0AAN9A8H1_HALRR